MEALITIENLKKIYTLGGEKVYALDGVNLTIYKEEILCLLGTSGSGKSTLLNMMAGLDKPSSGKIYIGSDKKIDLTALSEKQVTKFRQKNVGFVFQSYNLISTLNATENVSLGMIFNGVNKKVREEMVEDILKKVGLGDRLKHRPQEMSGGQQQRVSIARAFVDRPKIVFADEPTGNLDTHTSFEIMNLMCSMAREHRQTLIIVTHDIETAVYADRIVEMRDGKIISIKENRARIPKDVTKDEIEYIEKKTLMEIENNSVENSEASDTDNDNYTEDNEVKNADLKNGVGIENTSDFNGEILITEDEDYSDSQSEKGYELEDDSSEYERSLKSEPEIKEEISDMPENDDLYERSLKSEENNETESLNEGFEYQRSLKSEPEIEEDEIENMDSENSDNVEESNFSKKGETEKKVSNKSLKKNKKEHSKNKKCKKDKKNSDKHKKTKNKIKEK